MSKTILIIGNSDGIGAAVTQALVDRGDRVVGVSRSPSPLGASGPRHEVCDVASPAFAAVLNRLVHEAGPFDACVYCAGIGSRLTLPDLSDESRVFDVNLTALVVLPERDVLRAALELRAGDWRGVLRGSHIQQARMILQHVIDLPVRIMNTPKPKWLAMVRPAGLLVGLVLSGRPQRVQTAFFRASSGDPYGRWPRDRRSAIAVGVPNGIYTVYRVRCRAGGSAGFSSFGSSTLRR